MEISSHSLLNDQTNRQQNTRVKMLPLHKIWLKYPSVQLRGTIEASFKLKAKIKQILLIVCSRVVENVPGGHRKLVCVYVGVFICPGPGYTGVNCFELQHSSAPLFSLCPWKNRDKREESQPESVGFFSQLILEYSGQSRGLSCFPT